MISLDEIAKLNRIIAIDNAIKELLIIGEKPAISKKQKNTISFVIGFLQGAKFLIK